MEQDIAGGVDCLKGELYNWITIK